MHKHSSWKPQMAAKTSSYTFLILEYGSEIDFEKNIHLIGKVNCQWNDDYMKMITETSNNHDYKQMIAEIITETFIYKL